MIPERWLLIGLGNPGPEYENTRHNAGFLVVNALAERLGVRGKQDRKFGVITGTGTLALSDNQAVPLVIAQPLTYMNRSGDTVGKMLQYYKIPPERLLVIYDDSALPLGKIRLRPDGSAGGHNGMKSIIEALGGNERFPRLRIGIGGPPADWALRDHVLARFSPEEGPVVEKVVSTALQAIETLLADGVEAAMTRYNGLAMT